MNIQKYYDEWFKKQYPEGMPKPFINNTNIPGLRWFKRIISYRFKGIIKNLLSVELFGYHVNSFEKQIASSYLKYIFTHNPEIDVNIFIESTDEICSILDNVFLCVYNNYIAWNVLYSHDQLKRFDKIQNLDQKLMKSFKDYYECYGFKSLSEHFDYSVFIEKCGMHHIPEDVLKKIKKTIIVDCGAFIGDTAFIFQKLNPYEIIAIEPDNENFKILKKNITLNNMKNVTPFFGGVGDITGIFNFRSDGDASQFSLTGAVKVSMTTIDLLRKQTKERIGLIKMDIEGHELKALRGAEWVLKNDRPILIVSIYHSGRDFFEIPSYIHSIDPSYTLKIISSHPTSLLTEKMLIAY